MESMIKALDTEDLWRSEVYTDRVNGTINALIPVKGDGSVDDSREPIYQSLVAFISLGQQQQLGFTIPAVTLWDAVVGWKPAADAAIATAIKTAEEAAFRQRLLMPRTERVVN